jgi:hypothetical protein
VKVGFVMCFAFLRAVGALAAAYLQWICSTTHHSGVQRIYLSGKRGGVRVLASASTLGGEAGYLMQTNAMVSLSPTFSPCLHVSDVVSAALLSPAILFWQHMYDVPHCSNDSDGGH